MADTYCGLGAQINNDDHVALPDDDLDCIESDEDYDALNDETFGALEDSSTLDDWEQQHENFAKLAESRKHSDQIEDSLNKLVLDGTEDINSLNKKSIWSFEGSKNGENVLNSTIFSSLNNYVDSKKDIDSGLLNCSLNSIRPPPGIISQIPKKVISVEELERGLIKNNAKLSQSSASIHPPLPFPPQPSQLPHLPHPPHQNGPIFPHPLLQHNMPPRPPPGLSHHPHMPLMPPRHPNVPPNPLMHMVPPIPPHFMQGNQIPPPGMMYPGGSQFPVNHPYNFPPPPRNVNALGYGHPNRNQNNYQNYYQNNRQGRMDWMDPNHNIRQRNSKSMATNNINNNGHYSNIVQDEYAGLMNGREKQWLLNIQMLQLNTGTPYFDDYYYTIFKERKARQNKENQPLDQIQRHRRNSERQDSQNHLTPKVYTPLQFENSLGKLQCGSVTAPRKIIDMDVVSMDKESEVGSTVSSRDSRKTKQLLLELEALYSLLLKVEDLRNPMYHANIEKLVELKQKQRLRELETASTTEQKQEILKQLQQDSVITTENQQEVLTKVANGFCLDEKFSSFLAIRKGKMLLLRLLPYLGTEAFATHLSELWLKVLLSIPTVGRRDTAGDNLLPKLYPYFKKYIQTCNMSNILDIVTNLVESFKLDNSRSTPLSYQGKTPLNFIVTNKFGVSALSTMLVRMEYLLSINDATERQLSDWQNFVEAWYDAVSSFSPSSSNSVATPLESIPTPVFNKHCNRIGEPLTTSVKCQLFRKHFVDTE